ncbi:unnamed protein product [Vitrella brassicaformis CCMP3155]|uniref:Uncharacterized protein n=1 Tax=Vitrella brassicaformis (strain CCMP3155) TaxID=1169540 RepID=A0A0G4E9V5_VITBC|nr:unnamed protein product [Vitrella brassicaformis CCMP3155]|eukprot:CEL91984.1 unnamed protein product [Vitrella brassicaformis CCMP3155]
MQRSGRHWVPPPAISAASKKKAAPTQPKQKSAHSPSKKIPKNAGHLEELSEKERAWRFKELVSFICMEKLPENAETIRPFRRRERKEADGKVTARAPNILEQLIDAHCLLYNYGSYLHLDGLISNVAVDKDGQVYVFDLGGALSMSKGSGPCTHRPEE